MARVPFWQQLHPLILLPLLACGGDPPGAPSPVHLDAQPLVVTNLAQYVAVPNGPEGPYRQFTFVLEARLTNPSSAPLYLRRCGASDPVPIFGVIGSSPQDPEPAYDPHWGCAGHNSPLVVLPGATRTDRFQVTGPTGWASGGTEPLGALTGRFRLVYGASACREEGPCSAGTAAAVSNEFEVVLAN
jgi:hypothetical protein